MTRRLILPVLLAFGAAYLIAGVLPGLAVAALLVLGRWLDAGLLRLEQERASTRHAALLEALGALDQAAEALAGSPLPRSRLALARTRRVAAALRAALGMRAGADTPHQTEAR